MMELTKYRGLFTGCGVVDPTAMQAGALRVSQAPSDWSSIVAIMHGMIDATTIRTSGLVWKWNRAMKLLTVLFVEGVPVPWSVGRTQNTRLSCIDAIPKRFQTFSLTSPFTNRLPSSAHPRIRHPSLEDFQQRHHTTPSTPNAFSVVEILRQHDQPPQSSHPSWQQRPNTCTSAPPSNGSPSTQRLHLHEQHS